MSFIRQEGHVDLADDDFAVWRLHEDPEQPLPVPAKPRILPTILPGFAWPTTKAGVFYQHRDEQSADGYAEFTSQSVKYREGQERTLSPEYCD
jgi:hypothetical protein